MNPVNGEWPDFLKSNTALARYGNGDEIAAVAGPDASYISGAVINVDSEYLA